MKIVDNIVNTYACIKLTRTSMSNINIENDTDTTTVAPPTTIPPTPAKINIKSVNTITIMCPPIIFAKRRIVNAAGFVKIPKSSIIGIIGSGHLSHIGTSGQKISFQ